LVDWEAPLACLQRRPRRASFRWRGVLASGCRFEDPHGRAEKPGRLGGDPGLQGAGRKSRAWTARARERPRRMLPAGLSGGPARAALRVYAHQCQPDANREHGYGLPREPACQNSIRAGKCSATLHTTSCGVLVLPGWEGHCLAGFVERRAAPTRSRRSGPCCRWKRRPAVDRVRPIKPMERLVVTLGEDLLLRNPLRLKEGLLK
jgi:hypothetical protein